MDQENSSSAPSAGRSGAIFTTGNKPYTATIQSSGDTVMVAFRQGALHRFREYFKPLERDSVLEVLVDHAATAVIIEEANGICMKELRIFSVCFRFIDMSSTGCILIESVHKDEDNTPPPSKGRSVRDLAISGTVSGLIRWVLDKIFGNLLWKDVFVFPLVRDISEKRLGNIRWELPRSTSPSSDVHSLISHRPKPSGQTRTSFYWDSFIKLNITFETPEKDMTSRRVALGAKSLESPSGAVLHGEDLATFEVPISRAVDVKAIRSKLGMTQEKFATTFGLSLASLRNWEQGTRIPERPIAMYLRLIDKFPEEVRKEVEAMRLDSQEDA